MDRYILKANTKSNVMGARRLVNVVSVKKAVHQTSLPMHARALCWRWTPSGLGASPTGF
jgi:hypothetical protein